MVRSGLVAAALLSAWASAQEVPALGDAAGLWKAAWSRAAVMTAPPARPAPVRSRSGAMDDPWSRVRVPASGPARSIGTHSAGCLAGAEVLPPDGPGYHAMRPSRRRAFGHPRLVAYVRAVGAAVAADGLGELLVGDLGQPRGGPTLTGHASHQTGLDADFWFLRVPAGTRLSDAQRETMSAPSMVVPDFERLTPAWDPDETEVLREAASRPEVERIFVDPVVKKAVCARHAGAAWVGKLRPWWAHDDHFHVRLACAPGDALCRSAADPVPPGDGCGAELDSWFTPQSKAEARRQRTEPGKPRVMPKLPRECAAVLAAP